MIGLQVRQALQVPLEAESLSPDVTAGLDARRVGELPIVLAGRRCRVGDFFAVEGDGGEELEISGDVSNANWIGRGMTRGRIRIAGSVGTHLGAHMTGGTIEVEGNASEATGAEMSGGTIVVHGSSGAETGARMKRGTIVVEGVAGDSVGLQMSGGTIVLCAGAGSGTGGRMSRGSIVCLQEIAMLPTFASGAEYVPGFLRLYDRYLSTLGIDLPVAGGIYRRYTGDASIGGKGEILVWSSRQ